MTSFQVKMEDKMVLHYLDRLTRRVEDLKPAMQDIGEYLQETTKRRFDTSTGPDGESWARNTDVTVLHYLGMFKSSYTKDGSLSKKGSKRGASKKPLVGETRSLMSQIYSRPGKTFVEIGSPMVYSAMQQFGGQKSKFPHLWGDIPARPYLGLSNDDRDSILDIVRGYLGE